MSKYVGLKGKKILVVEDMEMNQYLARHIMESWGCVVEVVDNGRMAVEKVNEAEFDLVLMDIQMPVMDGIEATRIIRSMENKHRSTLPIVALTANALKADGDEYIRVGMNDWLAKPFDEPGLYNTVLKNIRKEGKTMIVQQKFEARKEEREKAEQLKMYDLSMVEAISEGDRGFILRMVNLFLETVPATLADLRRSADEEDWLMLSKHAHKLKSTIDSMGIADLRQDIRAIEAGGKTGGDPDHLRALVERVIRVMHEVMDQVREDWT